MKLPNWLKIVWWAVLTIMLGYFLRARLPALLSGEATAGDIVVFGVWMALLLAPLFTEVSVLGVTIKSEIEELKGSIGAQISDMRAEMRTYVGVSNTISPTIQFNQQAPVPDAELPDLETRVKNTVDEIFKKRESEAAPRYSVRPPTEEMPKDMAAERPSSHVDLTIDDDTSMLFAARYNLELELNRIAEEMGISPLRRPVPFRELLMALTSAGHLNGDVSEAIQEVQLICNQGVHGVKPTSAQISFVRDMAPVLVAILKRIVFDGSKATALAGAFRRWKPRG